MDGTWFRRRAGWELFELAQAMLAAEAS